MVCSQSIRKLNVYKYLQPSFYCTRNFAQDSPIRNSIETNRMVHGENVKASTKLLLCSRFYIEFFTFKPNRRENKTERLMKTTMPYCIVSRDV